MQPPFEQQLGFFTGDELIISFGVFTTKEAF